MSSVAWLIQTKPFRAGVRDRAALLTALGQAVRPDSASSVLVMAGFEGIASLVRDRPQAETDDLLRQLGDRLVEEIGGSGMVYASRRGEFCALCEGGLAAIRPLLITLPPVLDELARPHGVRCALGIAALPDEATLPTYALALADRRIRALSGYIRARVW